MDQKMPYLYHAADVSYFSGKARPALPQKSLWYREVFPDYEEIRKKTGLTFIPVLVTPEGEAWQDTSEILDRLEERHPEPPLFPKTSVQRVVAYLIELYGDELGILPAMHYRWNFEPSVRKARVDFAFSSGRLDASGRFADRMAGSLPFLGVTEQTVPAIEAHLRELLDALSGHFSAHRFLLGDSMSLADCGLMGPMYGHLFRDAVPQQLLYETAFEVGCWVERMNRPPLDQNGWLPDDALAPSLIEVLRVMADGVGLLVDAVSAVEAWADEHAADSGVPPRAIGLIDSSFRAEPLRAGARPYTLWMVQRPLDAYRALSEAQRGEVDGALAGTGWERLLSYRPRHRLTKRANELAWEA
jgi:glutathione S-transferase